MSLGWAPVSPVRLPYVLSVAHLASPSPPPQPPEEPADKGPEAEDLLGVERTPSGRIRRTSAQVAVFHLQEIAEDELARDWTKRRMKDDLVPETARVSPASQSLSLSPRDLGGRG